MEGWSGVPLTGVAANGDLTQLYPTHAPVGVNHSAAHNAGDLIRHPLGGKLGSVQVKTDGLNGGVIEIWDISGFEVGADVSLAKTITDAQLQILITAKKAKLIFSQDFASSSGARTAFAGHRAFMKGLAGRFVGAGTCELNLTVDGGYQLRPSGGNP